MRNALLTSTGFDKNNEGKMSEILDVYDNNRIKEITK